MPHLDEDVVNDVLGVRFTEPEPTSETEEARCVPIIKVRQRRTITVGDTDHEGFVGQVGSAQEPPCSVVTDEVVLHWSKVVRLENEVP